MATPTDGVDRKSIGPEEVVRQQVLNELKRLGWRDSLLQWKPEWRIPATPHDLTKRERGQKYDTCGSADLVAFADDSGLPHALQLIFEFKEPTIEAGRQQLQRYLSSEPVVRMGYWTNGKNSLAIYKSHSSDWIIVEGAPLPHPSDDFTAPPTKPPTWKDLAEPQEAELSAALRRLVATIVARDSRSVRSEDQLREILHVLLVKIESDNWASSAANAGNPVPFRIYGDRTSMVVETAHQVRLQFRDYFRKQRTRVFHPDDVEEIRLNDETLFAVVDTLARWRILGDKLDVLSKAFQIFRTAAMKSAGGQFLTPQRIIKPCVMAMEVTSSDKVIDPACGSGGFLIEALRQVEENELGSDTWRVVKFANDNLYGIDMDPLGAKLTKAMMIAMRDGSTHVLTGDAIRRHLWKSQFPELASALGAPGEESEIARQFTVVITNPPFGEDLKMSAADARLAGYTITKAASAHRSTEHTELEIGLIFLELAHKLLQVGGRVGIILPETYMFSHRYRWLSAWLSGRLALRGMINVPMEAFEEFCRAKTNFYIFEKVGEEGTVPVASTDQNETEEDVT